MKNMLAREDASARRRIRRQARVRFLPSFTNFRPHFSEIECVKAQLMQPTDLQAVQLLGNWNKTISARNLERWEKFVMHLLSETMDVQLCTCLEDDLASEFTMRRLQGIQNSTFCSWIYFITFHKKVLQSSAWNGTSLLRGLCVVSVTRIFRVFFCYFCG